MSNMSYSINIEELDNGFILNASTYSNGGDFEPSIKRLRKYITTMEEVTDEIKAFLGVDV